MSTWTLVDSHRHRVAGPFPTVHEAVATHEACPYVRLRRVGATTYDLDAGFSAFDHDRFQIVAVPAA